MSTSAVLLLVCSLPLVAAVELETWEIALIAGSGALTLLLFAYAGCICFSVPKKPVPVAKKPAPAPAPAAKKPAPAPVVAKPSKPSDASDAGPSTLLKPITDTVSDAVQVVVDKTVKTANQVSSKGKELFKLPPPAGVLGDDRPDALERLKRMKSAL